MNPDVHAKSGRDGSSVHVRLNSKGFSDCCHIEQLSNFIDMRSVLCLGPGKLVILLNCTYLCVFLT